MKKILVVDDQWDSPVVSSVVGRLEREGWQAIVIRPEGKSLLVGEEFQAAALYAVNEQKPDGVLLDVRFGEDREDMFKGLGILRDILEHDPELRVLMFTQYAQGPERETAVRGSLGWDAPVDFIDKLASPEEVVLRFRRLFGTAPDEIPVGEYITIDNRAGLVYVDLGEGRAPVTEIGGMKFEILRELAESWYQSPGELVHFGRLERYSVGEDARASLRVRIREIKSALGQALGIELRAGDLIVNVRDRGYRLIPPKL